MDMSRIQSLLTLASPEQFKLLANLSSCNGWLPFEKFDHKDELLKLIELGLVDAKPDCGDAYVRISPGGRKYFDWQISLMPDFETSAKRRLVFFKEIFDQRELAVLIFCLIASFIVYIFTTRADQAGCSLVAMALVVAGWNRFNIGFWDAQQLIKNLDMTKKPVVYFTGGQYHIAEFILAIVGTILWGFA